MRGDTGCTGRGEVRTALRASHIPELWQSNGLGNLERRACLTTPRSGRLQCLGHSGIIGTVKSQARSNSGESLAVAAKKSFQAYGIVLDIFVAYNNMRRNEASSTFAFFRFMNKEEAMEAVRIANGRKPDEQGKNIRPLVHPKNVVQDTLKSDAIDARVSPWHGSLVVIQLKNGNDFYKVWCRRSEMLHLGWGKVLKIHEESTNRERFDEARMLVSLQKTSNIPDIMTTRFNGVGYSIKDTNRRMWAGLIAKAKEGGIDVIQTYVFWNLHEPVKGQYDFSGRADIVRFIKEIQAQGLYASLRIGPLIEVEWNYGSCVFSVTPVTGE
ncbi:hypothetical protein F3Y22_tig00111207pilonHSYRG00193 [Hibiscus syriacus]|uniref:beta-galactosidase n=1 Tax=Hibiscus syriacus TaxID=106335 RepID=A0A6A2YWT8_HIBSY|nr:hypothetical protein F3Y22_tig00111207pilonHSYRG00193 [Hibiscus syriacus]